AVCGSEPPPPPPPPQAETRSPRGRRSVPSRAFHMLLSPVSLLRVEPVRRRCRHSDGGARSQGFSERACCLPDVIDDEHSGNPAVLGIALRTGGFASPPYGGFAFVSKPFRFLLFAVARRGDRCCRTIPLQRDR